jgi:hypothetical protein
MEDQNTQQIEEEEDLLAALLADEEDTLDEDEDLQEEAEKPYAKSDEKLAKKVNTIAEIVAKNERQKRADSLYSEFMAAASDTEKECFGLYADDDMTPAQMKKVIMLAKSKAATIEQKTSPEEVGPQDKGAEVVSLAKQYAAEHWGTGPIQGGSGKSDIEKLEEMAKKGDSHAAFLLFQNAAPNA